MAVPGVGGDFVGLASHRGDPCKPHLRVGGADKKLDSRRRQLYVYERARRPGLEGVLTAGVSAQ